MDPHLLDGLLQLHFVLLLCGDLLWRYTTHKPAEYQV